MRIGLVTVALMTSAALAEVAPEPPAPAPELRLGTQDFPVIETIIDGMPDAETAQLKVVTDDLERIVPSIDVVRGSAGGKMPLAIALVAPDAFIHGLTADFLKNYSGKVPANSSLTVVGYTQNANVRLERYALDQVDLDLLAGNTNPGETTSAAADEAIQLAIDALEHAPVPSATRMLVVLTQGPSELESAVRSKGIWTCWSDGTRYQNKEIAECEAKVTQHWSARFDLTGVPVRTGRDVLLSVGAGYQWTDTISVRFPADPADLRAAAATPKAETDPEIATKPRTRVWWVVPVVGLALVALLVFLRRR